MATLKALNRKGHYSDPNARDFVVGYITRNYTILPPYFGCTGIEGDDIAGAMTRVAKSFNKDSRVRLRHFVLSFEYENFITPLIASDIGRKIIDWLGAEYQSVYAVHDNSNYIHLHIVFNAVSFLDGHRYRGSRAEYYDLQAAIKDVLRPYGIFLNVVSSLSDLDIQNEL